MNPDSVKRGMRNIAIAFAVLALASPAALARGQETEHVSQTLKFEPGGTLRLKNFSGQVTITAGDRSDVVIDAVRRGTRDRLDRVKLDIHAEGNAIVVDANHRERSWFDWGRDNVVETDFDIQVPRRIDLDLSVFSSPVHVTGVEGSQRIHGFSSRVKLDDVVGSIDAHTFSGPVEIGAKSWLAGQTIDVDTFSGSIQLHVPDSAHGTVSFRSFSGHLTAALPLTLNEGNRRSLTARMGPAGPDDGRLRLKTFSGDVRIDR